MAEISFKVTQSGGYRDGEIISVKPDGWHIQSWDILAWVQNGVVPPSVVGMPEYRKRRLARRIAEVKWKLTHTAEEIEAEWSLSEGAGIIEKEKAENTRDMLLEAGLDTNWGYEDLKLHGVVCVDDVSEHDAVEFVDADQNTDHIGFAKAKRRWRFRYWEHLTVEKVEAFRDETLRVQVDRVTRMSKSIFTDEPREN